MNSIRLYVNKLVHTVQLSSHKAVYFTRLYALKLRLVPIFKQAEQHTERGLEPGSEAFIDLYSQASQLVSNFRVNYPNWKATQEIPALEDLCQLTIKKAPVANKRNVFLIAAVGFIGIQIVGMIYAVITVTYHGWLHLFNWLGL